jgi:hypothetical protein
LSGKIFFFKTRLQFITLGADFIGLADLEPFGKRLLPIPENLIEFGSFTGIGIRICQVEIKACP